VWAAIKAGEHGLDELLVVGPSTAGRLERAAGLTTGPVADAIMALAGRVTALAALQEAGHTADPQLAAAQRAVAEGFAALPTMLGDGRDQRRGGSDAGSSRAERT
jgi:hypothetical protein